MNKSTRRQVCLLAASMLIGSSPLAAQEPDCALFNQPSRKQAGQRLADLASLTAKVSIGREATAPLGPAVTGDPSVLPTIDRYIFQAIQDAGVPTANLTNDYEFIRRISLDLTGRVPAPERVTAFVGDKDTNKRGKLIDELLAGPEWVDKWTMFFGDLFKNVAITTQVKRYPAGVRAFQTWIQDALTRNKPYSQMAAELITAAGSNTQQQGELNFLVGGLITNGPVQDTFDQQAANVAQTFLGLGHLNCLLCHNGRGHLDALSLWGSTATRTQAWGMASYFSHMETRRTVVTPPNDYYYGLIDNARFRTDYALNTTSGNRPARTPIGAATTVAPTYILNGNSPSPGENYRAALAREITADPQFARAAVNYIWKEFFGVGIVEPADQFDPARLDPDNPPPSPWALQPSNARLLNALAQEFAASGFNLKALMKQITSSQAYQLSSRYDGEWKAEWDKYFARKFVRRLWAEEVHDAIAQTSGVLPSYNLANYGLRVQYAMQFPETRNIPGMRNPINSFLDAFLRGNREDEDRRGDGSIAQALNLMNDDFVIGRVRSSAPNSLLARNLSKSDAGLIDTLFLTVLSRPPSDAERDLASASLRNATNRTQEAETLLWSLYNKVDFVFNY